jgi:O-antigen/teichoic acid export membrane protein
MLKKIASTYQASLIVALLSFTTVWLTVRYLGTTGRGEISIFLLNVSLVQIANSVVGSGPLIYLYNRHRFSNIILLTTIWSTFCSVILSIILLLLNMVSRELLLSTILLSFLTSLLVNNYAILMAENRFFQYNLLRVLQSIFTILFLFIIYYITKKATFQIYISALFISYIIAVTLSFIMVFKKERMLEIMNLKLTLYDFFKFGGLNQLSNLLQLGNYRATLFMLSKYVGLSATGVFSLALTLTEAVWMFKDSIVTNHHSFVSRQKNEESASENNNKFMILSGFGTLIIIIIALLFPINIYIKVFGKGFTEVKYVLMLLSPGIIALSIGAVISHYFSGIGKIKINTLTSLAGLIVVLLAGFFLIPKYGINGAAIANTLSYTTTGLLLLVIYFTSKMRNRINVD